MAFNPFDIFRRNQKILFSFLTVIVMFMFVLSFGKGDFFEWLPRYLGAKTRSGDVMAVVDGSKVYESELGMLDTRRRIANQYMAMASARAAANMQKDLTDGMARVSGENKQAIQAVLSARPMYLNPRTAQLLNNPQLFQQFVQMGLINPEQLGQEREQTIEFLRGRLVEITNAKSPKENDLDMATRALALIGMDVAMASTQAAPGHYFTNQPNQNNRDLLEFHLWLKKADDLGIRLNQKEVAELVNGEFYDRVKTDDWKEVEGNLKGKRGFSPDLLKQALADEFRVRAAQVAVLGREAIAPDTRAYGAPTDYFTFYKDLTSPARFGFVAVPAENFLDKVTGAPTETELRDIFNKGKTLEPNPSLARPGLREPRKLKLEWLEAKGDEPFYKTAAAEAASKAEVQAKLSGFLVTPVLGLDLFSVATGAGAFNQSDILFQAKYQEYLGKHRDLVRDSWYATPFFGGSKPLDSSVAKPANVAALASALAGAYATGGSPFAGPAAFAGTVFATDKKARLDTLPAAFLVPIDVLGFPAAFVSTAAAQIAATQPASLLAVKGQLEGKAKDDFARTVANIDLTKFTDDLTKLATKEGVTQDAKTADAKVLVEKFVKDRGLKVAQSAEFRDQYTIGEDPGLKPLKAKRDEADMLRGGYSDPATFGQRFFFDRDPLSGQGVPSVGFYKPQPFPQFSLFNLPSKDEPAILVWRIAEQAAESPRDFNAAGVKAKAEAAWKRAKARELAKKAAEDLAKKCDGLGKSFIEIDQKLRDVRTTFLAGFPSEASRERIRYFEIDNVAPLVSTPMPQAGRNQIGQFGLAQSANIPYPTQKLAEDLVKAKDGPLSSSLVVTDNTEDTYYVAVLLNRTEKSPLEFELMVYGPNAGQSDLRPAVDRRHQEEIRKKLRADAVAMLKAEYKYEKENEKMNKKSESTDE